MSAKRLDAYGQSQHKVLALQLPTVSLDEDNCSFDDLLSKCHQLSQSNAALRREYDSMVTEKSAALALLRQQLAAMAQQELDESLSASVQDEVSNLKAMVDFLQQEQELTKAALRDSESLVSKRTQEANDFSAKLAALNDSVIV